MKLMNMLFGNSDGLHDDYKKIAKFAALSRTQALLDSVIIDVGISTRTSVEMGHLIADGFSFMDAAEIMIYPQYDNDGGVESERNFVKVMLQKFNSDGSDATLF
jgi:hypothetical protein